MAPIDPTVSSLPTPKSGNTKFVARQFRSEDLAQVHTIFAEGMSDYPEHKDSPLLAQYIQQSIESDLGDIQGTYMAHGGNFWVVAPADEPSRVVGMVALESKGDKEGELRRMSVTRDYRRYGIGRLLISTLEQWAAANGYRKVWLTTGAIMKKARAFYESTGYTQVEIIHIDESFYAVKFEKLVGPAAAAH